MQVLKYADGYLVDRIIIDGHDFDLAIYFVMILDAVIALVSRNHVLTTVRHRLPFKCVSTRVCVYACVMKKVPEAINALMRCNAILTSIARHHHSHVRMDMRDEN